MRCKLSDVVITAKCSRNVVSIEKTDGVSMR